MKLYSVLLSFLIILVVSCTKNTGVVVTNPDSNIVLDKIRYGSFQGVILNAYNVLSVSGSAQNNDGTYQFVNYKLTFYADFVKINDERKKLIAFPVGNAVYLIVGTEDIVKLMDRISLLGEDQGSKIFGNIFEQIKNGKLDLTKTDEILKDVNLSETDRKEIEGLLIASSGSISGENRRKMN